MDEHERTAAELAGLVLVVRTMLLAHAQREAARDARLLPSEALGYLEEATRGVADSILRSIPERGREQLREAWEDLFRRCFAAPEGIDLMDAFLRSEPPSGGRN
jgi:hypothetical protein